MNRDKRDFVNSGGAAATGIWQEWGIERKERKSQGPVVTCEGREGDGFWYAGTETGDAQVGV